MSAGNRLNAAAEDLREIGCVMREKVSAAATIRPPVPPPKLMPIMLNPNQKKMSCSMSGVPRKIRM